MQALITRRGGASPLDFTVVGGTTQPQDPKKNMIWVSTEAAVTDWCFSVSAPSEPSEGMVWIVTGVNESTAFNAVCENQLWVYVSGAYCYVSGEWKEMSVQWYDGSQWLSPKTYLYSNGNQFSSVTGGWGSSGYSGGNSTGSIVVNGCSIGSSSISFKGVQGSSTCLGGTLGAVDLTRYSKLYIDMQCTGFSQASYVGVASSKYFTVWEFSNAIAKYRVGGNFARTTIAIDVSSISGYCYIMFVGLGNTVMTMYEVYLV